ncbi:hypothetical protein DFH11DRAFT_1219404 [Phellopilus nigrolimitatus]|nr:hypothetical protein DFH11DRAFT_1219404 [Phellopilus nigrolimitatus]
MEIGGPTYRGSDGQLSTLSPESTFKRTHYGIKSTLFLQYDIVRGVIQSLHVGKRAIDLISGDRCPFVLSEDEEELASRNAIKNAALVCRMWWLIAVRARREHTYCCIASKRDLCHAYSTFVSEPADQPLPAMFVLEKTLAIRCDHLEALNVLRRAVTGLLDKNYPMLSGLFNLFNRPFKPDKVTMLRVDSCLWFSGSSGLPSLHTLIIENDVLTLSNPMPPLQLPSLRTLRITHCSIMRFTLFAPGSVPALRRLEIHTLTDPFGKFAALLVPTLEELALVNIKMRISHFFMRAISELHSLRRLHLGQAIFSFYARFPQFKLSPSLEELSISEAERDFEPKRPSRKKAFRRFIGALHGVEYWLGNTQRLPRLKVVRVHLHACALWSYEAEENSIRKHCNSRGIRLELTVTIHEVKKNHAPKELRSRG